MTRDKSLKNAIGARITQSFAVSPALQPGATNKNTITELTDEREVNPSE